MRSKTSLQLAFKGTLPSCSSIVIKQTELKRKMNLDALANYATTVLQKPLLSWEETW